MGSMMIHRTRLIPALVVCLALADAACAGKRAPILIGQVGLGIAQTIGGLGPELVKLEQAQPPLLSKEAALAAHKVLFEVNDQLKPLPDILDAINAAQQAGGTAGASDLDQALAILTAISPRLGDVLAGVPLVEASASFVKLVRAAQDSVSKTMIEVARIQGALQ